MVKESSTITLIRTVVLYILDGGVYAHSVEVTYDGGYTTGDIPLALQLVVLDIFDSVYKEATGAALSGSGISSVSVPNVGTVRFDNSAGKSSQYGAGSYPLIPQSAFGILDMYKRRKC